MCSLVVLVASLALVAGLPQSPSLKAGDNAHALPPFYDDFQCTEDGKFMDPYQCDLYWECEAGVATSHLCDDGLVFDELKGRAGHADPCDSPLNIDCTDRPDLQEPTYPSRICERRHGTFMDPDPTNCQTFHICKEGVVERSSDCPTTLHFNPVTGICEWPKTANRHNCSALQNNCLQDGEFCCDGIPVFTIHGELIPNPTFADPEDCAKFYLCLGNVTPQRGSCDAGLVYNEESFLCDFPENVPECYVEDLPIVQPTTTLAPVRRGVLN